MHLRLFAVRTEDAFMRSGQPMDPATAQAVYESRVKADVLETIGERWFNFGAPEAENRNAFTGIMTRDHYTKAASLLCLKEMLPTGKLTLVGEQEAAMARVVPHLFRVEIALDAFEWHVIAFDKKAKKPEILRRTQRFDRSFRAFRQANPTMGIPDALDRWTATRLMPASRLDRQGVATPFPGSNFASRAFPELWIQSPIQAGGETNKAVGFPVLSPRYRQAYRNLGYQGPIADPSLRDAIARRVVHATLQPASTFMNALRERVSFAKRAGGRGARSSDSYVNGACYNPRVLIAVLNIFRVYYNFFEPRPYVSPINKHEETDAVAEGFTSLAVPGTAERISVPQRRRYSPTRRTPAMRAGIHLVPGTVAEPKVPDLTRVLYKPWLFHGTPLWAALQGR